MRVSQDPPLDGIFLTGSSSRDLPHGIFLTGSSSRDPPCMVLPRGIFLTGSSSRDPPCKVLPCGMLLAGSSSQGLPRGILLTGSSSSVALCFFKSVSSTKHCSAAENKREDQFKVFIPKQLSKYK